MTALSVVGSVLSGVAQQALGNGVGAPAWIQGAVDLDFANSRFWDAVSQYTSYAEWVATVTVSVSVSANATYFDADGVMQNAAENALRFDHNPASLAAYGLLLEGERTNLKVRSQELDNATFYSNVRVTVTANGVVAPDGTTTADTILETAVTNTFHKDSSPVTITAGAPYSQSMFVQKLGRQYLTMDAANVAAQSTYDLDAVAVQASAGAENDNTAGIVPCANSWLRQWLNWTEGVSTAASPRLWINDLSTDLISGTHAGDTAKGAVSWGWQLEAGAFPSSHIRTIASSTVTRAADTFTQTVEHEASGSVRLYFRTPAGKQGVQVLWQRDDGTEDNRIRCARDASGNLRWIVTNGGVDVVDIDLGVVADLTVGYTDFNFATDDYSASLNGGTASTDTSGTMPAGLTTIRRGHNVATTSNWFGHLLREIRGVSKAGAAPFSVALGYATDFHYSSTKSDHDGLSLGNGLDKADQVVSNWSGYNLDAAVFGGDLVEGYGGPTESEQLIDIAAIVARFAASGVPVHYCLGNHDFDALTRAQVLSACGLSNGYYSVDVEGLHIVVLDGNYETTGDGSGYSDGAFDYLNTYINDGQRTWLAADLAGTELPVLVFVHQRADGTGDAYLDNASDLRTILETAGNVLLVVQGHHHVNALNFINGIPYLTMKDGASDAVAADATCAVFQITSDRIIVTGFGDQTSRTLQRRH